MREKGKKVSLQQIADVIKAANGVLIVTHMRPDGDAFGSSLALSSALDNLNIPNQVCDESDIPSNLAFINGVKKIAKKPTLAYDTIVALDCADVSRLGALTDLFLKAQAKGVSTISIDHHISNDGYAKYNFIRECAANCINVAELIKYMGVSFDKKTAEYLLIGLLTDSGNFSHDDVDEKCLLLAAELVKAGADIRYYNYELFKKQPKARAALYGAVMSKIRYFFDNRFALICITQEQMNACGADSGMTEGFVDFPLNVDTVEVAAALMEVKKGQYKISLRSKTYADVNKIAGVYGGGGHMRAAGCMLFGDLEEIIDKLSYTVSQYLE